MERFEQLLVHTLSVGLVCLATAPAAADSYADRATARELFFEAVTAVDAGDHERAAELFERSNTLYPAPTALLGLARALAATDQWVRATETYHSIVRGAVDDDEPAAFTNARVAAKEELAALEEKMPRIVVRIDGPAASVVTIDGVVVPPAAYGVKRPVDPGVRNVVARAEGYRGVTREVRVTEGGVVAVTLTLERLADARPPKPRFAPRPVTRRLIGGSQPASASPTRAAESGADPVAITGYVIGGIGVVGFIGAAVTGGLFMSARAATERECREAPGGFACSDEGLAAVDAGRALETANTALLIAGGIGVGAGVALVVAGHVGDAPAELAITPTVGPTEVGLGATVRF